MNGQATQTQPGVTRLNAAEFEQQWQEAQRCDNKQPCDDKQPYDDKRKPICPSPRPEPIVWERESKEINIYVNTEQSNHSRVGVMSWLPWLLLGLTSLLLLGNLFMMFAAAQSATNNTAREVNNTVNRSREVVRVERSERDVEPYYPHARW